MIKYKHRLFFIQALIPPARNPVLLLLIPSLPKFPKFNSFLRDSGWYCIQSQLRLVGITNQQIFACRINIQYE